MTPNPFLSRKFLLALLALLVFGVASAFRVAALISPEDWMKIATAVLGLYSLANVAQKATAKPATP